MFFLHCLSTVAGTLARHYLQSTPYLVVVVGTQTVADGVRTEHVGVGHVPVEHCSDVQQVGDGVGHAVPEK